MKNDFEFDIQHFAWSGSGTEADPYQIASAADLKELADNVTGGNTYSRKYFKVTADIDLSEYDNWTPIGNFSNQFKGTFDGGGFTISGLKIKNPGTDNQGLFGAVSAGGTVKNVVLESPSVNGSENVGALIGLNNGGTVNSNTVTNSTATGENSVGAFIGLNSSGTVSDNTVTNSTATGNSRVGALVGLNFSGTVRGNTVTNSTATGGDRVGGFIGYNALGIISSNTSIVTVSGDSKFGGFVGYSINGQAGEVGATNFYYSSTADSFGATRMFKVIVPTGVTVTGSTKEVDGVTYYYGEVTLTGESGKVIKGMVGLDITSAKNENGSYTFTPTADVTITEIVYAADFEGEGTGDSPYLITSAADLKELADRVNGGNDCSGKYFKVTADLDLSKYTNWTPIGNLSNRFKGNFDGGGKTISGLTINARANYTGLFGYVSAIGTVKNVVLDSLSVSGGYNVGALIGWNEGMIRGNTINGATVIGSNTVGGLIGINRNGIVTGNTVTGLEVTGKGDDSYYVGGLIGANRTGMVTGNTVTNAKVSGSNKVGGCIGINIGKAIDSKVTGNTSIATVTGKFEAGGFACYDEGAIDATNFYHSNTADDSSATRMFKVTAGDNVTIASSATKTVDGVNYYSGTITFNSSVTTAKTGYIVSLTGADGATGTGGVYSFALSADTTISVSIILDTGGHYVFASDTGTLATTENTTSYPDLVQVYRITVPSGVTVTGAININGTYYAVADTEITLSEDGKAITSVKNFTGTANANGSYSFKVGTEDVEITRLFYADDIQVEGEGTEDIPYLIASAADLEKLATKVNSGINYTGVYFKVTADLDLSEYTNWTPIGNYYNRFNGTFDGDGYTISGLKINRTGEDDQGLFGHVDADGTVRNVTLKNSNVSGGSGASVGALIAYNKGTVSNCEVINATVTGDESVGGLIGFNYGTVTGNTVINATVTGDENVGGCIGVNTGRVTENTSIATVTGRRFVGGFVGRNNGIVADSNYYYSNRADHVFSHSTRLFKITVPADVTASGSVKEIEGVTYGYGAVTITGESGKSIQSVTGVTGTANSDGSYTFTPTADTTISAVEYYSSGDTGTSIQNGTFEIDSYAETDIPASVQIGGKVITALGTYLQVTAENGEATSIKDIHIGGKFSVEENGEISTYEQTAVGLMRDDSKFLRDSAITGDETYTYTFGDEWLIAKILDDATNFLDVINESITYFNSDLTATVATYENGILTAGTATVEVSGDDDYMLKAADDSGVTLEGISDGAEISGEGNFEIETDSSGTFIINAETYTVDNEVVFRVKDGVLATVSGLDGKISGSFENGITVNREDHVVQIASDKAVTVAAAGRKVSKISVSGAEATIISAGGATQLSIDSDGEFTFGEETFTISDDIDGVTFALDKTGNVTGIDELTGKIIVAQDETIKVDSDKLTLSGVENPVTLTADGSSVTEVDGLQGLVDGLKNATVHVVDSDVTVNGAVIQIDEPETAFDVIISGGKISAVTGLSDGATLYGAGNANKFTTDEEGEFYLVNYTGQTQNFTVKGNDSVDFVISQYTRPDGEEAFQVEGVYNFENGTIIYDSDTAYHAINIADKASKINKNEVIHFGNGDPPSFANEKYFTIDVVDSKVASIDGISIVENLKGNVTLHGVEPMTVNGSEIYVEGDDDFNVIVEDGKAVSVVGIDDGATIDGVKIDFVTDEEGSFVFGSTEEDSIGATLDAKAPVTFSFDRDGLIDSISGLNGTIYFDRATNAEIKFNGTTAKITSAASLFGNGSELVSIAGFEDNTTIDVDHDEVIVVLENDKSVTVDRKTFALIGDKDSVAIIGNEITSLDAGASLSISRAGIYTVNGTAFDAKADDTFIATAEGVYIYDPNNLPVTTETATEDILTRFDVTATPETVKTGKTDLSAETVASAVSLTNGNQSVTFNNRGNNAAIVSETANGRKDIRLGDGGDLVVVEDTGADVTVTSGAGDDTIVNQGTNTYIDLAAGGADKVYALGGAATLDNYNASTGSGLQTDFSDIAAAIENGKINFRSGEVSLSGSKVYVNDGYDKYTLVDFYNINGEEYPVGFIDTEGGSIDLSTMNKSAILVGGMQASSSLAGSKGADTIYASAGDTINGNGGDNLVKLSTNRKISADGAAIEIPAVRSATIVENFKTGFDAGDDYIRADIDVSDVSYVSGDIVIKHDDSKVILKDVGDGDSAKILVDTDKSVIVGRGVTAKVADEVADFYIGDKSALDFSDDYERDVSVNLAEGKGVVGTHDVEFYGFNKITAGGGKTTLIGSEENEEFYAGSNDNSISGGGGSDTLHGYTGDDKNGSTEFFFDKDRATITGFEFTSSGLNPDKINTGAQGVSGVGIKDDDVYVELFNGGRLMIDGAAGKDFAIANEYDEVVAQISDGDLIYDGKANYFSTTTKSRAKLEISSEVDNAEIWLNNSRDAQFYGNIYELDASKVESNATLVGNDFDNVITAGKGNSSLWGGNNGNDSLIGGDGRDLFWYELGNGNDTISASSANDTVNLYGITLADFAVIGDNLFYGDDIVVKFKNGNTLTIENGKNSGATYTYDGTTWAVEGGNWVQK